MGVVTDLLGLSVKIDEYFDKNSWKDKCIVWSHIGVHMAESIQ